MTSLFIGLMATTALAAPTAIIDPVSRTANDLQGMAKAFDKIFNGLDSLNTAVEAYNGAADNQKIIAGNDLIVASINAGAVELKGSKTMALPDMLNILGPVLVMENKVGEVVEILGKNKDKLKGGNAPVLDMLTKDRTAADGLVTAIKGNLPLQAITGSIAGPIAALITTRLDTGIKEWGGTPPASAAPPAGAKGGRPKGGAIPNGVAPAGATAPNGVAPAGAAAPNGVAPASGAIPNAATPKGQPPKGAPRLGGLKGKGSAVPKGGAPPAAAPPAGLPAPVPAPVPVPAPASPAPAAGGMSGMAGMEGMSHGSRRV